jgi:hypothetical protein
VFPTGRNEVTSSLGPSRGLQIWLWAMLIAPFVPWYTVPIPIIVFIGFFFIGLTVGPAENATLLILGSTSSVLGIVWMVSAVLAFFLARRGKWHGALGWTLANLGCGATLLAISLLTTGFGPVEPFGYRSPLAFLGLAALPAVYEIARRWLQELENRSGSDAERQARSQLLAIGIGYGVLFVTSLAAVGLSTAAAIQALPRPHFYWDEMMIRESSAATFAMLGAVALAAFLLYYQLLLGSRAGQPQAA